METVKILMESGAVDAVTDYTREEIKQKIKDAKDREEYFVEFIAHRLDEQGNSIGLVDVCIDTSEIKGFMIYEYRKPTARQIMQASGPLPGMITQ